MRKCLTKTSGTDDGGAADVPPGASPCDDTSNLRVGEIAMDLGVTPQYLGHIFKAAVGKTPMEFILACRIQHAQFLLTQSDMTIANIAATCGFDDFNYFSRFFKKVHGTTPRAYRAMYRNLPTASFTDGNP